MNNVIEFLIRIRDEATAKLRGVSRELRKTGADAASAALPTAQTRAARRCPASAANSPG